MAEYYPLLERAVAGLQGATPESRRAIYERARNALLGQLRAMQPPVPEEDIRRESAALDEAITRLEERFGTEQPRAAPESPAAVRRSPRPAPAAPAPGLPVGEAPAVAPPPVRERPVLTPRSSASPPSPRLSMASRSSAAATGAMRPEPAVARPPASAGSSGATRIESEVKPDGKGDPLAAPSNSVPAAAQADEPGAAVPPFEASSALGLWPPESSPGSSISSSGGLTAAGFPSVLPTAPKLEMSPPPDSAEDPTGSGDGDDVASGERQTSPDKASGTMRKHTRDGLLRPAAPRAATVEPRSVGFYVVVCVGCLLVAAIAFAAWRMRDRPEQIAAARTENSSAETPGKIADRVGDDASSTPTRDAEPSSDAAAVPAPIPQSSEQPVAPASDAKPAAAEPVPSTPSIPVSQRAGLLVDAPEDPQKVKTYQGSVVWRSESVSPGQGQPLSTGVRADVDVPDAKLTMSMVLKKNLEPQFPASHTMEFHFTELPGNTLGPVKQINVPEMRKDDSAPTGDALAGVPVSITDDYFLVGLSRGGAEASNLHMMADRNWIDLSVLLKSGKVAKITFEKGIAGQQVLEDALKSWQ